MSPRYGLAVDVGTTTLVLELVELESGVVAATTSAPNPQAQFGADVMTRIAYAQAGAAKAGDLHAVLLATLHALADQALTEAGAAAPEIGDVVCVGNATMAHTLVGLDPTPLGTSPYRGGLEAGWHGRATAIGLDFPAANVYVPPGIRSHVGADTVAAILASQLDGSVGPSLLIDLGTNSEIVLVQTPRMFCTSTAAGPAFESSTPEGRLRGSQLITAVAERLRTGAIELSGRLPSLDETVTQEEVRQLQLAKAGVAAGVRVLLAHAKLEPAQLETVVVAGAFGNYLDKDSALAIGLLPHIAPERIRFAGNAALTGARLLLLDHRARARAQAVAAHTRYIELGGHKSYAAAFVEEIPFPPSRTRLLDTLSQLTADITRQSLHRCPYRAAFDVCTFRGPCRNRVRVQPHILRCGGGPLDSRSA